MFVNLLPDSEFVVVDLDSGTVLGTNVRLVRVRRGDKILLDLDDGVSDDRIIEYATNNGLQVKAALADITGSQLLQR